MRKEVAQPSLDEHGFEEHPAWVMIGASRVSHGPPGAVLFDSDIQHQHTVRVRLMTAKRKRDLHRDWIGGSRQIIEVEMSEAQWASFVSSMNAGDGVPATLIYLQGAGDLPGVPYEPRLAETLEEVRASAEKASAAIREAFAAYKERRTAENLRTLQARIENMAPNIEFSAKSLSEHAEAVVQRARADVEAMVVAKAQQLGLEPGDLGVTAPQLTAGEES